FLCSVWFFFFSSRRRHTRFSRDWSSDVCSSDLAGWALAEGRFLTAGFVMIGANIFDFIDGKVATETGEASEFGGFWDSVIDRFSDLALSVGLICLYASMHRDRKSTRLKSTHVKNS